jgi:hypothetical protein
MFLDLGLSLGISAICALIAWLAYLGVCVFITVRTGHTDGLRDLGIAARAFRRIGTKPIERIDDTADSG